MKIQSIHARTSLHRSHQLGRKEIKSPVTFSHLTFDYSAKLSYNKEYMIK